MDRIVAVESEGVGATCWIRNSDGSLTVKRVKTKPWILNNEPIFGLKHHKLRGSYPLRYLCEFPSAQDFWTYVVGDDKTRLVYKDFRQQFLITNPEIRLFLGMNYTDLKRVQIDIESTGLDPKRSKLLCVVIKCSEIEHTITGTEEEILEQINNDMQMFDPDVIEGHNIYGFDLSYLYEKYEYYDIPMEWGREPKRTVKKGTERQFRFGGLGRPVQTYKIYGRHIVDSLLLAHRYDVAVRAKFEEFGLKYLADRLGVRVSDRIEFPAGEIAKEWETNADKVQEYCRQDAEETEKITEIMVQADFYLTQLLPDTFQNVLLSGNATRVDQLMISEYLKDGHSIPYSQPKAEEYEGAFTECRKSGVFKNVINVDVVSMYPNIMLHTPIEPPLDTLGAFLELLKEAVDSRMQIKKKLKTVSKNKKAELQGMDSARKTLINSFYGYLAAGMHFSDGECAAQVTEHGRNIIKSVVAQIEGLGGEIIEVDTDGVYFTSPDSSSDYVDRLVGSIQVPQGIALEVGGIYDKMISLKTKNYILENGDKRVVAGASLNNRHVEPIFRDFIDEAIELCLYGDPNELDLIYRKYALEILKGPGATRLARKERVTEKTLAPKTPRWKLAAAIGKKAQEGDYVWVYNTRDHLIRLSDEYHDDEDTTYYMGRLYEMVERFRPVLSKAIHPDSYLYAHPLIDMEDS